MMFAGPPELGASTIVHLACSSHLADLSGGYFYDSHQIETSSVAWDVSTAQRLWQRTEKIAGFV
jgi:hypothetical protein